MRSIIIANEYDYLDNATRWPASSRVAFRIKKCECRVENEHFYLGFTGVTFCDLYLFVPTPSLHKNEDISRMTMLSINLVKCLTLQSAT